MFDTLINILTIILLFWFGISPMVLSTLMQLRRNKERDNKINT